MFIALLSKGTDVQMQVFDWGGCCQRALTEPERTIIIVAYVERVL